MKQRCHIVVKGRVQGVGFRHFTLHLAESMGICGWVRNVYDGSVEIEVEGKSRDLDEFLVKIKEGPRFGHVETVDVFEMDEIKNEKTFEINIHSS